MSKRMFSDNIVESDAFLDMPLTAQSLYFHLNMNADNDGFVSPKRVMRMCGAAHDDLQILIAKRFLLTFDSGVVVIKHWWINNTKRSDRHVPTNYQTELQKLGIKENRSYSFITTVSPTEILEAPILAPPLTDIGNQSATNRQPKVAIRQDKTRHVQDKTRQINAAQPIGNQSATKAKKSQGFKKNLEASKAHYAQAVRADEALDKRVTENSKRTGSLKTAAEIFGDKHGVN